MKVYVSYLDFANKYDPDPPTPPVFDSFQIHEQRVSLDFIWEKIKERKPKEGTYSHAKITIEREL